MKYVITLGAIVALTFALIGTLTFSGIQQGKIDPPIGTLRTSRLTVMSLPPCPTMPGSIYGPGRRCGSASPWMVWVIWRGADDKPYEWQVISMVLNGG
jgi:hypothetical protein